MNKYVMEAEYSAEDNMMNIKTMYYQEGIGWNEKLEFLYTRPCGMWTKLKFRKEDKINYYKFLDLMVMQTEEVLKKKTIDFLSAHGSKHPCEFFSGLRIIDRTFVPPVINKKCRWQMEFAETSCLPYCTYVVSTCKNMNSIDRYYSHISAIAS